MVDLYIGIDPGENMGVALYDKSKGLRLYTFNFWQLADFIENKVVPAYKTEATYLPHFYVENPNLNGFIYRQRLNNKNLNEALRMAQNVGMNKADAKRIIELIRKHGLIVEEIRPMSSSQKWTADFFTKLYGQAISTNQHVRDAAKLISRYWLK